MEELEITFLPNQLPPGVLTSQAKEILDIYIPSTSEHPILRIRKSGESYEITKKNPVVEGDSSRQIEQTIPLSEKEWSELATISGKRIHKTRFLYHEGKYMYQVDVFQGTLKGLVLVDVEFSTLKEKSSFSFPNWCLVDVTQEAFIAGGMLCGKDYRDINNKLDSLGYIKILV